MTRQEGFLSISISELQDMKPDFKYLRLQKQSSHNKGIIECLDKLIKKATVSPPDSIDRLSDLYRMQDLNDLYRMRNLKTIRLIWNSLLDRLWCKVLMVTSTFVIGISAASLFI